MAINSLIDAAPAEVQVASPTNATGEEVTLTAGTVSFGIVQDDVDEDSFIGKFASFVNQANGTADENCTPQLEVTLPTQPSCYNQVVYKDSADGLTSDNIFFADDILAKNINDVSTIGVLDDGSGILKELDSTTPCSKSVTEYYIDRIGSSFDRAQSLAASLYVWQKNH